MIALKGSEKCQRVVLCILHDVAPIMVESRSDFKRVRGVKSLGQSH